VIGFDDVIEVFDVLVLHRWFGRSFCVDPLDSAAVGGVLVRRDALGGRLAAVARNAFFRKIVAALMLRLWER
jgi:hypothetical protein